MSTFHDSPAVMVMASQAKSAKHDETFPVWDTDRGKSMMDRLHQQLQQILGSSTCTRASSDHVRIEKNAFSDFECTISRQSSTRQKLLRWQLLVQKRSRIFRLDYFRFKPLGSFCDASCPVQRSQGFGAVTKSAEVLCQVQAR